MQTGKCRTYVDSLGEAVENAPMMDRPPRPEIEPKSPLMNSQDAGQVLATTHPRATLAATILGSSVAFIDGSVVNVALPALKTGLDADGAGLAWTISAYLLPLGALTLLGGALGDQYGRRRMFLIGLSAFTVASIVCGIAPSLEWFLLGRCAQGVGAALLLPNSLALLGSGFEGAARGRAIGSWAAVGALLSALGPLLGGWLVDTAGWRTIFFINVPLAFAAAVLSLRFVEESSGERKQALDWTGGLLATFALLAITLALTWASEPAPPLPAVAATAAAGLVLLSGFTVVEIRKGKDALMPVALFSTRPFIGLSLLTLFLYAALGGLVVLLPYFLIKVGEYSAVSAGAAMLPLPVAIGIGSPFVGRLSTRFGTRALLGAGSGIVAVGLAAFMRVAGSDLDYLTVIFPAMFIVSVGMMLCVAPLTTAVIEAVGRDHVGAASGLNSAVARVGGLLATASLGSVFVRLESADTYLTAFHTAALCGAALALASAASVLLMTADAPTSGGRP